MRQALINSKPSTSPASHSQSSGTSMHKTATAQQMDGGWARTNRVGYIFCFFTGVLAGVAVEGSVCVCLSVCMRVQTDLAKNGREGEAEGS